jgi:hypothetical protein
LREILKDKNIRTAYLLCLTLGIAYGMVLAIISLYLTNVHHYDKPTIANLATFFSVGIAVFAVPMGMMIRRLSPRVVLAIAMLRLRDGGGGVPVHAGVLRAGDLAGVRRGVLGGRVDQPRDDPAAADLVAQPRVRDRAVQQRARARLRDRLGYRVGSREAVPTRICGCSWRRARWRHRVGVRAVAAEPDDRAGRGAHAVGARRGASRRTARHVDPGAVLADQDGLHPAVLVRLFSGLAGAVPAAVPDRAHGVSEFENKLLVGLLLARHGAVRDVDRPPRRPLTGTSG